MLASNFPVDCLVGTFHEIHSGFLTITAQMKQSEQEALFYVNAMKFYQLSPSQIRQRILVPRHFLGDHKNVTIEPEVLCFSIKKPADSIVQY